MYVSRYAKLSKIVDGPSSRMAKLSKIVDGPSSRMAKLSKIVDGPSSRMETVDPRPRLSEKYIKYHIVQHSEVNRLDLIAFKYYNDAKMWWLIADANDITDPSVLSEGTVLKIPNAILFDLINEV